MQEIPTEKEKSKDDEGASEPALEVKTEGASEPALEVKSEPEGKTKGTKDLIKSGHTLLYYYF